MPAKNEMSWEPRGRRWWKMHGGKRYVVSCRQLSAWVGVPVPETKEQSYQHANRWWQARRVELEGELPPHAHRQVLDELNRRKAWAVASSPGLVPGLEAEIADLEDLGEGDLAPNSARVLFLGGEAGQAIWSERLAQQHRATFPSDRTVAHQVERYLALERVRAESGQLSASEFDTIRRCLSAFRDHVGGSNPVDYLDADRWEGWWSALISQPISVEYKKKRLRIARSFVAWLSEKGLIPLPPNLQSRRHRFGGGARSVPTIPLDDVRTLIAAAPGQLRLHLLLMLNCGMTQADVSDLAPGEVDWQSGRITRKRSKTDGHENVPTVEYPLWPRTRQLLQKYGHRSGDHALMTESGRPWVRDLLKSDGKRSKVDSIKSNYVHLQRKTGLSHPMKLFRKTSATLIESHELFGRYTGHFLGHAPRSIAERHYAAPSIELFDRIVVWLGDRYEEIATEIQD